MGWQLRRALLAASCWLAASAAAAADTVLMRNGDRLSGRVVHQADDRLTLETSYAGTLELDWTEVAEVQLAAPTPVLLRDARVLAVTALVRDGEDLLLSGPPDTGPTPPGLPLGTDSGAASTPMRVDQAQVQHIAPTDSALGRGHQSSGAVNLALTNERGNTDNNDLLLNLRLDYRHQRQRLEVLGELQHETSRGERLTDKWSLFNRYSHDIRGPWYGAAWLRLSKDRDADLRFRYLIGPALGYRLSERPGQQLSAEIGPIYINETYYQDPSDDHWGPGWNIEYEQLLPGERLTFYHRQLGFVGVDADSLTLWLSWTGLRLPLANGFTGTLEYQFEYDSKPGFDARTTDATLRLMLGYQW